MTSLVAAVMMLLLGVAACLLPLNNHMRGGVGVFSRVIATGLVLSIVTPVLIGGAPLTAELAWAYPVMGVGAGVKLFQISRFESAHGSSRRATRRPV